MKSKKHAWKILVSALFLCGCQDLFSQNFNHRWANSYGAGSYDGGTEIKVDESGYIYVTGYFSGSVDFGAGTPLTSSGSSDLFIARYDSAGAYQWAKAFGGTGNVTVNSMAIDANHNTYVAGYFNGTANFSTSGSALFTCTNVYYDIFFAKYNSNGSYQWAKTLGSTRQDIAHGIALDNNNNIYITGEHGAVLDCDPSGSTATIPFSGMSDIFVAKYNSNGDYIWANGVGSTGEDFGKDIAIGSDNNVYLTGYFQGTVDFDPSGSTASVATLGFSDAFIAKYNGANGAYLMAKGMGGPANEEGITLTLDGSNNIYITGRLASTSSDFDPGPGTANLVGAGGGMYFGKYTSAGNYVWAHAMGLGSSMVWPLEMRLDKCSSVYLTGFFSYTNDFDPGPGTANLTSPNTNFDAFVARYDSSGKYIKAINLGANNQDQVYSIAIDDHSNFYITGGYETTVDFDPGAGTNNLTSQGNSDIYMAKYNALSLSLTKTDPLCYGACNGNASVTVTNGVSPYSYLWSNSQSTSASTGLCAVVYSVTVTESTGCTIAGTVVLSQPAALTTSFTTTGVSCFGGSNGAGTVIAGGGTQPYVYLWNAGSQTAQTATGLSASVYSVTVTDSQTCAITSTVSIAQPAVLSFTKPVTHATCYDNDGSAGAVPAGGTAPYSYSWSSGSSASSVSALSGGTYSITVTDNNGCAKNDLVVINNSVPMAPVPICLVTVDSVTNNNIILWTKPANAPIDSFIIYRDTSNNNFAPIGKVWYGDTSRFVDTVRYLYAANGDPTATSWKYKIAVQDTCGNISPYSLYHKTLFIQNNSGNFSWNDYLIEGQPVPVPVLQNYLFQRDNVSNDNWVTIQTLSASSLAYTDPQYATYQNTAKWRVETLWTISCTASVTKGPDPLATTVKSSKSNSSEKLTPLSVGQGSADVSLSIYPNPSKGQIKIQSAEVIQSLTLSNIYGEEVLTKTLNTKSALIDLEVADGIYFLKLNSQGGTVVKKVVVNH